MSAASDIDVDGRPNDAIKSTITCGVITFVDSSWDSIAASWLNDVSELRRAGSG